MTRSIQRYPVLFVGMLLVASVLTGCSTSMVPFTHELRSQHGLTNEDVQQLQFYVSHEVTLRRDAHHSDRRIDGGRLKLFHGKQVEEVVLLDATPGIATQVAADKVVVSFAEGADLTFSLRGGPAVAQPLRVERGKFAEPPSDLLLQHRGKRVRKQLDESLFGSYFLRTRNDAQVSFQGRLWEADTNSFKAHLMIDAEALEEVVETREVLGGRKISANEKRLPLVRF